MKVAALFSGGKDSMLAALLAKKEGHELACLISLLSENTESYMFHTPSITKTKNQADAMDIPLIQQVTKGEKETELEDLKKAIFTAKKEYGITGIVTGAVESVYQASRVQRICHELGIECFNPLWQMDQVDLLTLLLQENFEVMIIGVFAYPFDKTWLGKTLDESFIETMKKLHKDYAINPAGEGGEYESFVLDCPLFKKKLEVTSHQDEGEKHSWKREVTVT